MRLRNNDQTLLVEIISKRRSKMLWFVEPLPDTLSDEQREELREALAEELAATGLDTSSEPNDRGLAIERLIDVLGNIPSV